MEMTMLLKLIQKLEHICMFFLRHGGIQILALFIVGEEIYQKYKAHNDKNSVCMSRNKNAVKGIVFGKKGNKLYYSPTNGEGHVACFAGSGLGKTSSILISTLQHWDGTSFVIDISGDICDNVEIQNKIIFDPDNADSILYNIFYSIDKKESDEAKDEALEQLAYLLMPLENNASDTSVFFTVEGRKILTASLITYYHMGMDFVEICERIVSKDHVTLFEEIDAINNYKALQYVTSFAGTSERNTAGCKQACDTAIRLFATNPHIKKSVGRPQKGREAFVPEQLEEKNVYVKIQDAKLELYALLLHIITAQCMDYFSYRANNHQNTILFCLDEFASFGRLDITAALRKLRKKHVRIMILTQSMADIDMIYGKDERMAMLNNFTYKVVLGCSDSDTQEYFSRLIGEQNAYRKGISKNGRQITNSKTEVRERIVPPAELARLGRKLILLTSGEYYILRKNFYFESSLWDRIIKYMKNLSREDEEDFPTENTLALDKKKEKI